MNLKSHSVTAALTLTVAWGAFAQGTFQNLGFEAASVGYVPPGQFGTPVSVTAGLPAWSAFIGGVAQSEVWHNNLSLGSPVIAILGPDFAFGRIEGAYSVLLSGSFQPATISQSAVPHASSRSLYFRAISGNGTLAVAVGGNQIALYTIQSAPTYTLYACDISPYVNGSQPINLSFTALTGSGLNNWYLDSVEFSTQAIPEPSAVALASLGVALVLAWQARKRNV